MNQPPEPEPLKLNGPFTLSLNPCGIQLAGTLDGESTWLVFVMVPGEAQLIPDPSGKQRVIITLDQDGTRGLRDLLTEKLNDKRIILPGEVQ